MPRQQVLVTGGSGFLAGHCILRLLGEGYLVRATLRSPSRESAVRKVLSQAGMTQGEALSFVTADLTNDHGWAQACQDIDWVLHVASPVRPGPVEREDEVIVPARQGTLRVLRAARATKVKRVVLTSAFHAVSWGYPHSDHVFTEEDWTILDGPGVDAYGKSKTLAERAAWDFIAREGGGMELVTLLPVAIMGPIMGQDISGANHIIKSMLDGGMRALPHLYIPIVDVRDVAAAHVLALQTPGAAGERLLLSNGPAVAMTKIASTLRDHLGQTAGRVPTKTAPNLLLRAAALFSPALRHIVPDLGYAKQTTNEKARRILGWSPAEPMTAVVAAGESITRAGLAATQG